MQVIKYLNSVSDEDIIDMLKKAGLVEDIKSGVYYDLVRLANRYILKCSTRHLRNFYSMEFNDFEVLRCRAKNMTYSQRNLAFINIMSQNISQLGLDNDNYNADCERHWDSIKMYASINSTLYIMDEVEKVVNGLMTINKQAKSL